MNQNIEIALKQAFNLIESERLEDARAVLRPILESEKDNVDIWWVYAHAVTDVETARLALNNVLRLDANYPGARELYGQLQSQEESNGLDNIDEISMEPSFVPALPTTIPGITPLSGNHPVMTRANEDDADFADDLINVTDESFYRRPLFYVPLISLFVIVALAIVIFKPFSVSSPTIPESAEPTNEFVGVVTPTSQPITGSTPVIISEATLDNVPIETPVDVQTEDNFPDVASALSGFSLQSENAVTIENTVLGRTLIPTVCTTAGREMRVLLPQVMIALANVSKAYVDRADAVAVRMKDCDTNSTLLQIGSPITEAIAFSSGEITDVAFQAGWKPL